MCDWSRNAAQRLQCKSDEERIRNERVSEIWKLLNERSNQRWKELRNEFVRMATELNSEPGMSGTLCYDSNPDALCIENTLTRKSVNITFEKESHSISTNDRFGRTYQITVVPGTLDTCVMAVTTRGIERIGGLVTHNEIARSILDELLGIA